MRSIKLLTIIRRNGGGATYMRCNGGNSWTRLVPDRVERCVICHCCGGTAPIMGYLRKSGKPAYFAECRRCGNVTRL